MITITLPWKDRFGYAGLTRAKGRVFSSVRETIALLLNYFCSIHVYSLSRNEKQSTQNTMKECQAVHRCFASLRIKLFLFFINAFLELNDPYGLNIWNTRPDKSFG